MKPKICLLFAAVKGAEPDMDLLLCARAAMKRVGGYVGILPMKGLHKDAELHEEFDSPAYKIITGDQHVLGEHIMIDRNAVRPEQANPFTGLLVDRGMSIIVPSPKQYFNTVCRIHGSPEVLYSTGACTKPLYNTERSNGRVALRQHVMGGLMVEVNGLGQFFARHIRLKKRGFTDLGCRVEVFGKGGVRFMNQNAAAIVYGDWHTGPKSTDPVCRMKNFEMAEMFQPGAAVLHDIMDGASINHHEMEDSVVQSQNADAGLTLKQEFAAVAAEIKAICDKMPRHCKVIIPRSNHDEFPERYIRDGLFLKNDRANAAYGNKLWSLLHEGKDMFAKAILEHGPLPKVSFLKRCDSFRVGPWELGKHGDKGPDGAKLTTSSAERLAGADSHIVVGHQHRPQVFRGAVVVGTSTRLPTEKNPLPYTSKNPSSWLHANALIWPDDSCQLIIMPQQMGCRWTFMH